MYEDGRVRDLTPCESLQLMGVADVDVERLLLSGVSKSGLYKLAGNSIVAGVLCSIFSNIKKLYNMKEKLRVFTTFSGYDSQCLALKYAGIDYELVGWSEIEKSAIIAHDALFPEYAGRNYGDVTKIDWSNVPDFDLLTYSSPCQDISNAGRQRGLEKGSGTRSSLLWEVEKAIKEKRPKYLLMENVAALVGKKFIKDFEGWLDVLEGYGYKNYWKVLNAKDYGVPQNRKRVFVVSILGAHSPFYFPEAFPLELSLSDVLQPAEEIGEKYFLTEYQVKKKNEHCDRKQSEG